jgi:hypothetical protein
MDFSLFYHGHVIPSVVMYCDESILCFVHIVNFISDKWS